MFLKNRFLNKNKTKFMTKDTSLHPALSCFFGIKL